MQRTALDIIRHISTEIEHKQPTLDVMMKDIQMMGFKIRSLIGDISIIDGVNIEFISALWKIGKVDEIINSEIGDMSDDEQEMLLDYFDELELYMREQIKGSLKFKAQTVRPEILKLEIFKEFKPTEPIH